VATSTRNGIGTTNLTAGIAVLDDPYVQSLLDGARWGPGLRPALTTLTYSFPGELEPGLAARISGYGVENPNEWASWWTLRGFERDAVVQALDAFSEAAALSFLHIVEEPSTSNIVGDLRFASSDAVDPAYAWAYTPGNYVEAGDVWFSRRWYNDHSAAPAPGSKAYQAILHEIGHALGLKHPFDDPYIIPADHDSMLYTVMSYSPMVGGRFALPDRYPTTPMLLDVKALEWLYGPSQTANVGPTLYEFSESGRYWQTIVDSDGLDTLRYSGSSGARISLVSGDFSTLGQPIVYDGTLREYRTVWLGPSAVIERAVGGGGADTILGNRVDNRLAGRGGDDWLGGDAGADRLFGNAGADRLEGGAGEDTLAGGGGADRFVLSSARRAENADRIDGFVAGADTLWLDHLNVGKLDPGTLPAWQYRESHDVDLSGARQPGQHVLYDLDSGRLYYDHDGSGPEAQVLIATLTGSPDGLSAASIVVY
jgi:Ca2+-binding RTX toxin-like protein